MKCEMHMPVHVLLVEDEPLLLEGLQKLIDWQSLGLLVAACASSYEEALAQAQEKKPELIITDIMLGEGQPTGLDLVKKLRPLLPRTKVVLLTGYDLFEYAKEAIQYTVKAYLLKPIDRDTLMECVLRIRQEILVDREKERAYAALSRRVEQSLPFLFDWLFTANATLLETGLPELLPVCYGYTAIVSSFDERCGLKQEQLYALFLEMTNLNLWNNDDILFFFRYGQYVSVLLHRQEAQREEMYRRANSIAEEIQEFIEFRGVQEYVVGIGLTVHTVPEIRISYDQAIRACSYQHFVGMTKLIGFRDVSIFPLRQPLRFRDVWERLALAARTGEMEVVQGLINDVFAKAVEQDAGIGRLRGLGYEALVLLDDLYQETGIEENPSRAGQVATCTNLESLVELVLSGYHDVSQMYTARRNSRNSVVLKRVLEIIDQDYGSNLNLEQLASAVYLSPSYLSYLFSTEIGKPFKTHLTEVRVEKAQELLRDISLKVYEVSERVGYSDTRYFGQVFKRVTGVTPLQYRNRVAEHK